MHDTPDFREEKNQIQTTINISTPEKRNFTLYERDFKHSAVKALENRYYYTQHLLLSNTHSLTNNVQVKSKNPQTKEELENFTGNKADLKNKIGKGKERYSDEECEGKREKEENNGENIVINNAGANDLKQVSNQKNSKTFYYRENYHDFTEEEGRGCETHPRGEDSNIGDIDRTNNGVDGDCWCVKTPGHETQDPKDKVKVSAINKLYLSRIQKSSSASLPKNNSKDETKVCHKSTSRESVAFQSEYKHKKLRKEYDWKHQPKRKQKDSFQKVENNKESKFSDKNHTSKKNVVKDLSSHVLSKEVTNNLKVSDGSESNVAQLKRVRLKDDSHQLSNQKLKDDEPSQKRLKHCPVYKTYDECTSKRITANELETPLKGTNKFNETNSKFIKKSEMNLRSRLKQGKLQRDITSHSPSQITQYFTKSETKISKSQPSKRHETHTFDGSIKNYAKEKYNKLNVTKETLTHSSKNPKVHVKNGKSSHSEISSICNKTAESVKVTKSSHKPDKKAHFDSKKSVRRVECESVSSKTKYSSHRNAFSSLKVPDTTKCLSTKRKNVTDDVCNRDNSLLKNPDQERAKKKKLSPTIPQIKGICYDNGLCDTITSYGNESSKKCDLQPIGGKIPVVVLKDVKKNKRGKKEKLNLCNSSSKTKSTQPVLSHIYQGTHILCKAPCKVKVTNCKKSTCAETSIKSSLKPINSKAHHNNTCVPQTQRTELLANDNKIKNKITNEVNYCKRFKNECYQKPSLKVSINLSVINNEIFCSEVSSMRSKKHEERKEVPNFNNMSIIVTPEGDTTDKIKENETPCSQSRKYLNDTSVPKTNIEDIKIDIEKGSGFQSCYKTNVVRSKGEHRDRPYSTITANHRRKSQKVTLSSVIRKLKCNRAYFYFLPKKYKSKRKMVSLKVSKAVNKWKINHKKSRHDNETCSFEVRSAAEKDEITKEVYSVSQQNVSQQSVKQEEIHNVKSSNEKHNDKNAESEQRHIAGFERQVIEALEIIQKVGVSLHNTLNVNELCGTIADRLVLKSRSWLDPSAQVKECKGCTMKYQNGSTCMQYLDKTNKSAAYKMSNNKLKTNMSVLCPMLHFHDDNCIITKTCYKQFELNPFGKGNISVSKNFINGIESYTKENVCEAEKNGNNTLTGVKKPETSQSVCTTSNHCKLRCPYIEPFSKNIFDMYKSIKCLENYYNNCTNEDLFVNSLSTKHHIVENVNSTSNYVLQPPNQKFNEKITSRLVQNGVISDTHLKQRVDETPLFSEEKVSNHSIKAFHGLKLEKTEATIDDDDINQQTNNDTCISKLMIKNSPTRVKDVNIVKKRESYPQTFADNTKLTNHSIFDKRLRDQVLDKSDRKEKCFNTEYIEKEEPKSCSFQETNCMDNKSTTRNLKKECSENDEDVKIVFSNVVSFYRYQEYSEQSTESLNSKANLPSEKTNDLLKLDSRVTQPLQRCNELDNENKRVNIDTLNSKQIFLSLDIVKKEKHEPNNSFEMKNCTIKKEHVNQDNCLLAPSHFVKESYQENKNKLSVVYKGFGHQIKNNVELHQTTITSKTVRENSSNENTNDGKEIVDQESVKGYEKLCREEIRIENNDTNLWEEICMANHIKPQFNCNSSKNDCLQEKVLQKQNDLEIVSESLLKDKNTDDDDIVVLYDSGPHLRATNGYSSCVEDMVLVEPNNNDEVIVQENDTINAATEPEPTKFINTTFNDMIGFKNASKAFSSDDKIKPQLGETEKSDFFYMYKQVFDRRMKRQCLSIGGLLFRKMNQKNNFPHFENDDKDSCSSSYMFTFNETFERYFFEFYDKVFTKNIDHSCQKLLLVAWFNRVYYEVLNLSELKYSLSLAKENVVELFSQFHLPLPTVLNEFLNQDCEELHWICYTVKGIIQVGESK